jgi:hypothetical protein
MADDSLYDIAERQLARAEVAEAENRALTARAERAEAAEAAAQAEIANGRELRNILTGHLADANDRAQRAAAAIERVRALASDWATIDAYGQILFTDAANAIVGALDIVPLLDRAQRPAEGGPEGEGAR